MKLPYDLLSGTYKSPDVFLCDVDKSRMCKLNATGLKGSFKFNAYSEISFDVGRTYVDTITGETKVFPFYDKIETPRLIELNGFGYFEIQGPDLSSDGIKESQTITAYSLEYTLSTKYLENFQINTGAAESVEVGYAYDKYYVLHGDDYINYISPVTLYNEANHELSLLHLAIEKAYGWKIGHVDASLRTLRRKFNVDRQSIYDFLMNEVCEKFNCYIIFDTAKNEINVYAESKTSKFIGDGITNKFTISPKFDSINTVSVDGYKTTKWSYNSATGVIALEDTPESGAHIEVIDGALTEWETDVFVTFENLAQVIKISCDSDEIKTQLTVTYGDDLDIREANLGIPYLTDLSYYYTVDWMGQDLYDAYTAYLQKSQNSQAEYKKNTEAMLDVSNRQNFEEMRLSMGYGEASVLPTTVGTYYVRGGSAPNYYYTEVSLPADYDASVQYYKLNGTNINTGKVKKLYEALQKYFKDGTLDDFINDPSDTSDLTDDFSFMTTYKISNLYNDLKKATTKDAKELAVNKFLDEMWNEVGRTPLQKSYKEPYEKQQTQFIGYAKEDHQDYSYYYATVLILDSIKRAIDARTKSIEELEKEYQDVQKLNTDIVAGLAMDRNFTENQLIRLSAFIREDELQLDDIVETDEDTIADSFKIKEDAIESGRIELHKLSQPKLQFSMTMANIYAIKAFEPIIDQFQLGNVIKVGLRKDYIKQSRLLQVDLDFDNLANLSTEFGELTNLRTQSDIHADLLGQAISAGKSVAQNSTHWTKGSDTATSTDLKIQNGLLDAATVLKSIDATQGVEIDKYGVHLKKVDSETGEVDPRQGWIINNMMAYTDDNWKTTKTVLGEFKLRGEENSRWGLISDAVLAGYVEGSTLIGGTIDIGDGTFTVDEKGNVVMNAATISGYATDGELSSAIKVTQEKITTEVSDAKSELSSSITQTANDIRSEVKDTKEELSSSITQTASDIRTEVKDADDKLASSITQTASDIRLEVKDVKEELSSAINVESDRITAEVTRATTAEGNLSSKITVAEGKITTEVSRAKDAEADLSARITVTENGIATSVQKGSIISSINQSAEAITINANKISLAGKTISLTSDNIAISSTNFSVTKEGKITAKSGTIGGWSIDEDHIYGWDSENVCFAKIDKAAIGESGEVLFGAYDGESWPFYVSGVGKLYATGATIEGKITADDGEIGGWTIGTNIISGSVTKTDDSGESVKYEARMNKAAIGTAGHVVFGVYDGSKWSAYIDGQGKFVSQKGLIANWSISENHIHSIVGDYRFRLDSSAGGDSNKEWISVCYKPGEDGESWPFYVSGDGKLHATGATISGKLTATSGTLNNCTIKKTCTIEGTLSASNVTGGTLDFNTITVSNLSASDITTGTFSADRISGGTLTIGGSGAGSISIETAGGGSLTSYSNGIRIYSKGSDPYFIVSNSAIYNYAGGTYFYLYPSGTNGAYLYSPRGITFSTSTNGYLNGTWYLNSSSNAVTSDENKKNTIVEIDEQYNTFFDNIGCYTFKYNEGTSDRLHCGFISQRIKQSLDIANISTQDFGGVVTKYNDDGTEDWYIRYEEFIPLNTWQIQKLKTRVAELENRLAALEERN